MVASVYAARIKEAFTAVKIVQNKHWHSEGKECLTSSVVCLTV